MTERVPPVRRTALLLASALTILCLFAFFPSLMVMGFSFYVFEARGPVFGHAAVQWLYFVFACSIPVALIAIPVLAWLRYRRGAYAGVRRLAYALAGLLTLFAWPFWLTFFT